MVQQTEITEKRLTRLLSLIESSMKGDKLEYALVLLNQIIDSLNYDEEVIKRFKAKKVNIEFVKYDVFIEKIVFILQIFGFSKAELCNYDDEALRFLAKNRHLIKKPLTVEYFNSLHSLYRYYEFDKDESPKSLKDLADAYSEIEDRRSE